MQYLSLGAPLAGILFVLFWVFRSFFKLRDVPGPFLASWTNFPRLWWVLSNRAHDIHIQLHRQHGKLVRFGPNMVSISDPAEIPTVYGFSAVFQKSDFYHVLLLYARGKPVPTIFATQDEGLHRTLRKPIAAMYSMSQVVSFESQVNSTMDYFFQRLDALFADGNAVCNLAFWLQAFAFDVIGEITFSRRMGFLEKGKDIEGIMASIWKYFFRAAPVTQMPWLDLVWTKNPIKQRLRRAKPNPIVAFATARAQERQSQMEKAPSAKQAVENKDFLSRFLEVIQKDKQIPPFALTAWTTSNVTAGSDTTAILLRSIFYSLMRHPQSMRCLLDEIDQAAQVGALSRLVTWKEARALPYLDACIKEAARLHPPFGLPFERVVPSGGATICGRRFAAGTVVAIPAFVVHRDVDTFGGDSDEWRPERWFCEESKRRRMENSMLTVSEGPKLCPWSAAS
ncbi:MAG: hypothetical protein Q9191_002072 [Dirinaria sp. TL-2023a]